MPDWGFEVGVNLASWFVDSKPESGGSNRRISRKNGKRKQMSGVTYMDTSELPLNTIENPISINNCLPLSDFSSSISHNSIADSLKVHTMTSLTSSRSLHAIPNNINPEIESLPVKIGRTSFRAHSSPDNDPVPFRASGLRFILRCSFQISLAVLSVSNVIFQYHAVRTLENNFHYFACSYALLSLVTASVLLLVHMAVALVTFVLYLRYSQRRTSSLIRNHRMSTISSFDPLLPPINHAQLYPFKSKKYTSHWAPSPGKSLHCLALISSSLLLFHHILCDFQFAFLFSLVTFLPAETYSLSQWTRHTFHAFSDHFESESIGVGDDTDPWVSPADYLSENDDRLSFQSALTSQRSFASQNFYFTTALVLTATEVIIHWCQSWVIYLWQKPCCYFAEKFPKDEKEVYNEAGVLKGVQIICLPVITLIISLCGALSLSTEYRLHPTHPFIVALWLSTLLSVPFILAVTLLPVYYCLKCISRVARHVLHSCLTYIDTMMF